MRQYFDDDGNEVTLESLCRSEPNWAANRIVIAEAAVDGLRRLLLEMFYYDTETDPLGEKWEDLSSRVLACIGGTES